MATIKNIKVVNVSELFSKNDLELFQDEVTNMWTWGDTAMSLVPIDNVRVQAEVNKIEMFNLFKGQSDIMVNLSA
jgi:hypothetical protein